MVLIPPLRTAEQQAGGRSLPPRSRSRFPSVTPWLRTKGVNISRATAKVTYFDRLGKKIRPGTFGEIQVG